ncbi:MAG: hypothetical protein IKE41_00600, partial [Clostridia bacterium]|nr:hypothetical protein [Clostridia bacterium]
MISIFGTNPLKKLMHILKKIKMEEFKKDVYNYFRFERMKQRYSEHGRAGVDKLFGFFGTLKDTSKNIYEKAKNYLKTIDEEAKAPVTEGKNPVQGVRPIIGTQIYQEYRQYIVRMVQLSQIYDFFNDF